MPQAPRPPTFSPVPVTEQKLVVLSDRAHRVPVAAVEVVHTVADRTEAEVPRVDRVARIERTRPVVAAAASVVELIARTVARGIASGPSWK